MIYPFTATPLPTLAQVGGKGLSLMRMAHADLPVPPGFVLSVAFFEPWLTALQATPEWTAVQTAIQNNADLAPGTAALKAACAELALTTSQEQQLAEALKALPKDSFFAVRSSSPEEDLEGASFAGGYKTSLGVTEDTLLEALRASFSSAFDERVFVYKQQHGFAIVQPRIAVVVQQQIAADSAGVGFSLNPLNNDYDEAVIDANWGLGESVVAGMVSPDHFVVDKVAKRILEKQLGSGVTINRPMMPLTIDWMFGSLGMWAAPIVGPIDLHAGGDPARSVIFGAGGRFYMNLSQIIAVVSLKLFARRRGSAQMDALLSVNSRTRAVAKATALGILPAMQAFEV